MAVIIHEFEMDVQAESQTPSAPPSAPAPPPQPLGVHEVECMLRCQSERALRVWAH
jgi:hypothetical protein